MAGLLEVCVEDASGLRPAVEGGAHRIELCSALPVGGITPSAAMISAAAQLPIPVHVLIRPRAGDFVYDTVEQDLIAADIRSVVAAGLAGLVIGASRRDLTLDTAQLEKQIDIAREAAARRGTSISLALHRAFDVCPDPIEALEAAIKLGFERILTSGGAVTAMAGRPMLSALVKHARGRIKILAASGINAGNVHDILATGVDEIHASCQVPRSQPDSKVIQLGFEQKESRRIAASEVSALASAIRAWCSQPSSSPR